MKVDTALGLLFCGGALSLSAPVRSAAKKRVGRLAAGLAGLLGVASLVEYAVGLDPHIDQLFWLDAATPVAHLPGRMSSITALNFVLFALGFLVAPNSGGRSNLLFLIAAASGFSMSYLILLGYAYGAPVLYSSIPQGAIAVPAAVSFLLLSIGLMALRPDLGWVAMVRSPGVGDAVSRWALPAVLLLPPTVGWLRLQGELAGLYDPRIGLALFA